jgi:uncharacterized protein (DUF1778 family)
MAAPVKKIRRFLEASLSRVENCDIILYKILVNGRKEQQWNSEKRWAANLDDTVTSIADTAQGMADAGQGVTKFMLQAIDPEADMRVIASTGFALAAEDSGGEEEALSEPATMQGLLALLMRHNSELHRQSSGTWGVMFQYMTRIIERQSEQLERLQTQKDQSAETMEALISKKHQRDMESKQIEAEIKRKDEMFGKIMMLLPVAVNKIAGKEIVRQRDTLLEITSAEFLSTITGDKIEALIQQGIFDKHQMSLLMTMLEEVNKRMVTSQEKQENAETANQSVFGSIAKTITSLVTP